MKREQEDALREEVARAYEATGNPGSAKLFRKLGGGHEELFRALLPLLATPEMRECADACRAFHLAGSANTREHAQAELECLRAGRAYAASLEPDGPWHVKCEAGASHVYSEDHGRIWRDCSFFGPGNTGRATAECQRLNREWREQNEKERAKEADRG